MSSSRAACNFITVIGHGKKEELSHVVLCSPAGISINSSISMEAEKRPLLLHAMATGVCVMTRSRV